MKTAQEIISIYSPCAASKEWLGNERTIEQMVNECERGDWLLWLAKRVGIDKRLMTLAKGRCAETVIHLMKDERSIAAVKAAIAYGNGEITDKELAAAAYSAAAAAAAYSAYSAAAYSAADAAADADAAAAAYSAADAAAAYSAAAYSAADARKSNRMKTADACRLVFGKELIDLLN